MQLSLHSFFAQGRANSKPKTKDITNQNVNLNKVTFRMKYARFYAE